MKNGAFIIPTGIGANIGGFAGDASIWARELSKKTKLLVNPNVVNAACFSGITENMLYVEGFILDDFFKGRCGLLDSKKNKIGVVFDKSISEDVLNIHINTINAVKTVYGIDIYGYEITKDNVGVEFFINKSGESVGNVKNLDTIRNSAQNLINKGCDAIAIVCHFPEDQGDDYANGIGVDPVGGVEAIISHYISKELKIPCAHAPAFSDFSISTKLVNPKCAAEYITPTFLPCILIGLSQAPKPDYNLNGLTVKDLDFIVMPFNSLGCIPVLEMNKLHKDIFVISENKTILDVAAEKLKIKCKVIESYQELIDSI
ncbi:MAG: DUF3326 domain-containing protein [Cyanobacteria bacterium SIG28]|nr:DUF3326 domain-containing protein [Cyanobacteria bacterium SIG28]